MLFHATAARRKLIVIALLLLAVAGGAIRAWAPNPSTLRDIGSLLLVLWVPVIGNVIAYLVRQFRIAHSHSFSRDQQFAGELLVEMLPLVPVSAFTAPITGNDCALVVGTEGFTVRLPQPVGDWIAGGIAVEMQVQFLKPSMALPLFAANTPFRIVAQQHLVGQGRVLRVLG